MNCYICDDCRIIIDYGFAPNTEPHRCESCQSLWDLREEINRLETAGHHCVCRAHDCATCYEISEIDKMLIELKQELKELKRKVK